MIIDMGAAVHYLGTSDVHDTWQVNDRLSELPHSAEARGHGDSQAAEAHSAPSGPWIAALRDGEAANGPGTCPDESSR